MDAINQITIIHQNFVTNIIHNNAKIAAVIAEVIWTEFSKLLDLNAGADPVNIIPAAAKNAVN